MQEFTQLTWDKSHLIMQEQRTLVFRALKIGDIALFKVIHRRIEDNPFIKIMASTKLKAKEELKGHRLTRKRKPFKANMSTMWQNWPYYCEILLQI